MKTLLTCKIETAINPSNMTLTDAPILLNGAPVGFFKDDRTLVLWIDFGFEHVINKNEIYVSCANIEIPKTIETPYRIEE